MSLVPTITDADLDRLEIADREFISRAIGLDPNQDPELQDEIEPERLRAMMATLGVEPVWAQDHSLVFRANYQHHILLFQVVPDPALVQIPQEVLDRVWIECADVPELLNLMNEFARGVRELEARPPVLIPEDHPEVDAIGFVAPEANRVWLLSSKQVLRDLEAGNTGGFAHVPPLIQSNQGRQGLAQRIAGGLLVTEADFARDIAPFGTDGKGRPRRRSDVVVDILTSQFSDRYKQRFLKGPR